MNITGNFTGALGIIVVDAKTTYEKAGIAWRTLTTKQATSDNEKVKFPILAGISSANVTTFSGNGESGSLAYSDFTNTPVEVKPLRHAIGNQMTFLAEDSSLGGTVNVMGAKLGNALAAHMDTYVFADMKSALVTTIGTGSEAISVDDVMSAVAKLRAANIEGPYFGVLNPAQVTGPYGMSTSLIQTSTNAIGTLGAQGLNMLDNGEIGMIAGVEFYWSNAIVSETIGANETATALIYSADAQAIAFKDADNNGTFIKTRVFEDIDTDSNKLVFNGYYGTDTLFASASVGIISKIG